MALGFPAVESVFVRGALGVNFRPSQEFAEQSDARIFEGFGGSFKAFDLSDLGRDLCFIVFSSKTPTKNGGTF